MHLIKDPSTWICAKYVDPYATHLDHKIHVLFIWIKKHAYRQYSVIISFEYTHPRLRTHILLWGRYHGGRRPSSDDSFHSATVFPPSALDKPSIMKRYHRRRTCSHTSPRRSPTMVTLHDTRFVECGWWSDGWTVKTVVAWRSSASMIPALVDFECIRGFVITCTDLKSVQTRKTMNNQTARMYLLYYWT